MDGDSVAVNTVLTRMQGWRTLLTACCCSSSSGATANPPIAPPPAHPRAPSAARRSCGATSPPKHMAHGTLLSLSNVPASLSHCGVIAKSHLGCNRMKELSNSNAAAR